MSKKELVNLCDGTFLVPLTKGYFARIDETDAPEVGKYNWHVHRSSDQLYYAVTDIWSGGKRSTLRLHRLITQAFDGETVDHINHNGLDNRRSNLRICNQSENIASARKKRGATSHYKGVWFDKVRGKWSAQCGQQKLGRFDQEEDAARAYDKKARELFGEFAHRNFPED